MFGQAKKLIEEANTIYMVAHTNPDGDAIGSTFAMYFALRKMGKQAKVIMPKYSDHFAFLPEISSAVDNVEEDEFDLLICLDSSSKERLAINEMDYNKAKKVLMIDHHMEDHPYGDVRCINHSLPAVCQLVYAFLKELDVKIDLYIATYLYTGILTDSGSFNYSSTTPETLRMAADLIETGIHFWSICKRLNDTMKECKLRLIAKTIDNMESYFDGKMRYSYVDYATMQQLGIDDEDAEGMTNYLRSVEGTEIAVYVREREDGTNKVSMRSGGNLDVSKIALAFGGGGHPRAAGYTMLDELDVAKEKLINVVEVMLSDGTPS